MSEGHKEGEEVTPTQPTAKELELINTIANLTQDKVNLVEEIKQVRKEKQEVKKDVTTTQETPEDIFNKLLEAREKDRTKESFEEAEEEFKNEFKEFEPTNDPGGLKYAKFQRELRKFNFSDLKSKDGYKNRLKEVYEFMNRKEPKSEQQTQVYNGSPVSHSAPETKDLNTLSNVENALIAELGWTKEKYLAAKAKRPAYVETLLRYRS